MPKGRLKTIDLHPSCEVTMQTMKRWTCLQVLVPKRVDDSARDGDEAGPKGVVSHPREEQITQMNHSTVGLPNSSQIPHFYPCFQRRYTKSDSGLNQKTECEEPLQTPY
jgi:hypothetical protein